MKNQFKILSTAFLSFLIFSCQTPTESIAETVKESMEETFNQDEFYKDYNLEIKSVSVVHVEGNKYKGFAEIGYMNKVHNVSLDIVSDGSMVMWEAPPGEFFFILSDELENLWNGFDF